MPPTNPTVANTTPGNWTVRRVDDDVPEYWETELEPEPLVYVPSRQALYSVLSDIRPDAKVWGGRVWCWLWRESLVDQARPRADEIQQRRDALRDARQRAWTAHDEAARAKRQADLTAVEVLPENEVLSQSCRCLHALNRLAKHQRVADQTKQIYRLKSRYLASAVRAEYSVAAVETYTIEQDSGEFSCLDCDNEWVGRSDYCYACCDHTGVSSKRVSRWYVVDIGGYRFHQPAGWISTGVSYLDADQLYTPLAVTVEPHDPTQPTREIPDVGLHVDAQLRLVERACQILESRIAKAA